MATVLLNISKCLGFLIHYYTGSQTCFACRFRFAQSACIRACAALGNGFTNFGPHVAPCTPELYPRHTPNLPCGLLLCPALASNRRGVDCGGNFGACAKSFEHGGGESPRTINAAHTWPKPRTTQLHHFYFNCSGASYVKSTC